jgi:hypothetical protein
MAKLCSSSVQARSLLVCSAQKHAHRGGVAAQRHVEHREDAVGDQIGVEELARPRPCARRAPRRRSASSASK